ncbi:MAG TPA: DUF6371 domain-containing protein, partial [Hyphomicrobiaceae bacterium]|nr:DUF6371 domain-containing protein [Hyphomicrobiaceae bacterium]
MTGHLDETLSDIAHEITSAIAEPESKVGAAPSPGETTPLPQPYRAHPSFGNPTAVWPYRDAKGGLIGFIGRFDPPDERKQFLPFTPVAENGQTIWKHKSFDAPRPLFGLDRLAARRDAPVLVVEGEKAAVGLDGAGGAAAVVPSHVAITSPGGSNAAATADWSPLSGRDVVIWPDADKAGADYAKDVAARARKAGARSVQIVDTFGLPESFDLGDPLPEGLDVEARIHAATAPLSYI